MCGEGVFTFADFDVVVRVEDCTDCFCALLFTNGAFVVTRIELFEVEFTSWFRRPQTKIIRRVIGIARDYPSTSHVRMKILGTS